VASVTRSAVLTAGPLADRDIADLELGLYPPIAPGERSCCCPSRRVARIVLPPTPQRDHTFDVLLCAHHSGSRARDDHAFGCARLRLGRRPGRLERRGSVTEDGQVRAEGLYPAGWHDTRLVGESDGGSCDV
jgi:hypothetical protein